MNNSNKFINDDPRSSGWSIVSITAAIAIVWLYVVVIVLDYRQSIAPNFSYLSFVDNNRSPIFFVLDAVLLSCLVTLLPFRLKHPSDFTVIMFFILAVVPCMVMSSFLKTQNSPTFIGFKISVAVSFALFVYATRFFRGFWGTGALQIDLSPKRTLLFLAIVSFVLVAAQFGASVKLVALSEVYDRRAEFKDGLVGAGYVRYVIGIMQNTLSPVMIGYGLYKRSKVLIICGVFLSLYVFSVTGLKSAFSTIVYVFGLYYFNQYFRNRYALAMLVSALLLLTMAFVGAEYDILGLFNDLVVRRIFLMQGLLTFYYNEFFFDTPSLWLSHSVLSPFFSSTPVDDPAGALGAFYFGDGVHANANYLADAYVNGKLLGMLAFTLVAAAFFSLIDSVCRVLPEYLGATITSMISMMLVQSGIITVIGTHGGLLLVFMLLVLSTSERLGPRKQDTALALSDRSRRLLHP